MLWPHGAKAQAPIRTVGVLTSNIPGDWGAQSRVQALRQGLADLGWTEHTNLILDVRYPGPDLARQQQNARELIERAPDVLVAHVTGELDFLTTPRLEKYLHERTTTNGTRHVVLELSGVTYLGSTGASLLVALARDPTILSAELHLTGVRGQARVQRPLDLMALTKIFDIHDDVEHFLALRRQTGAGHADDS